MKHNIFLIDPATNLFPCMGKNRELNVPPPWPALLSSHSLFLLFQRSVSNGRIFLWITPVASTSLLYSEPMLYRLHCGLRRKSSSLCLILFHCWQRWCCCAIHFLCSSPTFMLLVRFHDKRTTSTWKTAVILLLGEFWCVACKSDAKTLGVLVQKKFSLLSPL